MELENTNQSKPCESFFWGNYKKCESKNKSNTSLLLKENALICLEKKIIHDFHITIPNKMNKIFWCT